MAAVVTRTTFRCGLLPAQPEKVWLELDHPRHGRLLDTVVPGGELGLPTSLGAVGRYDDPQFRWPDWLGQKAKAAFDACRLEAGEPVWIEVGSPAGILPVVAWERLLGEVLDIASHHVYRLPYHPLPPVRPAGPRHLALCASSPAAKAALPLGDLLHQVIKRAIFELPEGSEIHVFTDRDTAAALPAVPGVVLHDPERERALWQDDDGSADGAERWLEWMTAALAGRPVDGIHWIGHGYLSAGQGAFAIAESPGRNLDRGWARFLWPGDLCRFLNHLGAWWLGVTVARPNFSALGLRLLADRVARARPGPIVLHDLRDDGDAGGIAAAYACLAASDRLAKAPRQGLSFYCPPVWVPAPRAERREGTRRRRSRSVHRRHRDIDRGPRDLGMDGDQSDDPGRSKTGKTGMGAVREAYEREEAWEGDIDFEFDVDEAAKEVDREFEAPWDKEPSEAATPIRKQGSTQLFNLYRGSRRAAPAPWLAAAQRVLEQSVSAVEVSAEPDTDRAARRRGVENAYSFLQGVVAGSREGELD